MIVFKSKNVIRSFQANDFTVSNTLRIHVNVKIKKSLKLSFSNTYQFNQLTPLQNTSASKLFQFDRPFMI